MDHAQQEIEQLLKAYREGKASAEQKALLEQWYHSLEYDASVFTDEAQLHYLQQQSWQAIRQRQRATVVPLYRRYWQVAAAVLVLLVAGTWWWRSTTDRQATAVAVNTATAIRPGTNKATLTLSNGSVVVLDSNAQTQIADAGGIHITNRNNQQLSYQPQPSGAHSEMVGFNMLSTPRGGQYQLTLPDGSMVWLNSASQLKYPISFQGNERVVELSGEAYFEVAENAKQPFKVIANGIRVDVLGTKFNINAYHDEASIKTTLVQGSVRVSGSRATSGASTILRPGQQAIAIAGNVTTRQANIQQVLSWKNGLFVFEDRKLDEVLREVSRWYDIEIEFRAPLSDNLYGGVINRHNLLPKVLELLEKNGIQHFKIEGRKVIVLP